MIFLSSHVADASQKSNAKESAYRSETQFATLGGVEVDFDKQYDGLQQGEGGPGRQEYSLGTVHPHTPNSKASQQRRADSNWQEHSLGTVHRNTPVSKHFKNPHKPQTPRTRPLSAAHPPAELQNAKKVRYADELPPRHRAVAQIERGNWAYWDSVLASM